MSSARNIKERTRWQRLFELLSLVSVGNSQSVQVLGAPDLELGGLLGLPDLHRLSILAPGCQEELLDVTDLLWLHHTPQVTRLAAGWCAASS